MSDQELSVRLVAISDLKLDPENVRKHPTRNLQAIQKSLSQFGQRRALLVSVDSVVIAGNGTLESAKALGWKQIAVSYLPENWTPEQMKAYAIADNRTAELAVWDEDALVEALDLIGEEYQEAAGFNQQELDRLLGADLFSDRMGTENPEQDEIGSGDSTAVIVGSYRVMISREKYDEWLVQTRSDAGHSDEDVKAVILERLGL